ncbi:WXG100 family type VII secretion target [Dictyobacter kobayashii]|uniref:Uncharacterized protein n=1 Tax=Dictyobacter kobayashii TaxID=2014872 RepID=A0A402AJX8_9CHLR|nr:WXG100 family type VII secretion target [Dictyobacter kobayashii]GCE19412.1 hypothetical protein KDK_32120 [Dictyobacter kobayashii]
MIAIGIEPHKLHEAAHNAHNIYVVLSQELIRLQSLNNNLHHTFGGTSVANFEAHFAEWIVALTCLSNDLQLCSRSLERIATLADTQIDELRILLNTTH